MLPALLLGRLHVIKNFVNEISTFFLKSQFARLGRGQSPKYPAAQILEQPKAAYEEESQAEGFPTQAVTLLQPLANWLPMLVCLIATQKTKATSTTIKVYSTKP